MKYKSILLICMMFLLFIQLSFGVASDYTFIDRMNNDSQGLNVSLWNGAGVPNYFRDVDAKIEGPSAVGKNDSSATSIIDADISALQAFTNVTFCSYMNNSKDPTSANFFFVWIQDAGGSKSCALGANNQVATAYQYYAGGPYTETNYTYDTFYHDFCIEVNSSGCFYYIDKNPVGSNLAADRVTISTIDTVKMFASSGGVGLTWWWDFMRGWEGDINNEPVEGSLPVLAPTVEPPTLANNSKVNVVTNPLINFSCANGYNVTIYFGDTFDSIPTVRSAALGILNYSRIPDPADGTYYYVGSCNGTVNSSVFFWTFDSTSPVLTTDFVNDTQFTTFLNGSFNFTDNIDLNSINITINTTKVVTFINVTGNRTQNVTLGYPIGNLTPGRYLLNVIFADSHTAKKLGGDYEVVQPLLTKEKIKYKFWDYGEIETYQKDASLFDNWQTTRHEDRYTQTFRPSTPKNEIVLIETCSEPIKIKRVPGKYKSEWIICGSHWKDYVLENEPESKVKIKLLNPYTAEVTIKNINNRPEMLVFESVGDLNIVTEEFTFIVPKLNINEVAIESELGVATIFTENKALGFCNSTNSLPFVNYTVDWAWYINKVPFSSGNDTGNFNNERINYANLSSGDITQGDELTFSCQASIPSNTTGFVNATTFVTSLTLGSCNDTDKNITLMNMTYHDEVSGINIIANDSVELTYNFELNAAGQQSFNFSFLNGFSHGICTNVNFSSATQPTVSGTFLVKNNDYATNLFTVLAGIPISLNVENVTQVPIYLIKLNDSTTVNFNWFTTNFQAVDGVQRIYRCLGNGTQLLTQSVPIVDGQSVTNLELLSTPYSYEILIGSTIFRDESSYSKCHIESQEDITFYVNIDSTQVVDLIRFGATPCNLTKTGDNTVKMEWTGNENMVGCLEITRESIAGKINLSSECSGTSPIERSIPVNPFTYTVTGKLFEGGFSVECSNSIPFQAQSIGGESFGTTGLYVTVLMVVGLSLIWAGQGPLILVGAALGVIGAMILGVNNFGWTMVITIVMFLVVVGWAGRASKK